jgi:UPF0755 protein
MDTISTEVTKRPFFRTHKVLYLVFFIFFIVIISYYVTSAPSYSRSRANREPTIIHISKNEPLDKVVLELESKDVVRYHNVLKIILKVLSLDTRIEKGDYLFDKSVSAWSVAWRLARGQHNIDPIKVTFREGLTNEEMATLLGSKLSAFRRDLFLSDKRSKQGYLFPDTYFFFPMTSSDEIVDELSTNFNKRIASLRDDITKSGHTESEIIIMASIIQKEAQGESDAPVVSGILWKRIAKGMPLQVDAARETYSEEGLPSLPIANPGLVAIKAAINPKDSPYLYYLHDKDGIVHFAQTYDEHKKNITKYLR